MSDRSSTIRFNSTFPSSRWRNRFISAGIRPAYFFRQLQNVAPEMRAFR
ncbi:MULTISPECIES: hypothetical protein [Komagataeibacter]|uniref:Uncharacterized protein n=1 Tax=Komagataeibacter oboediens TaxID=65958 RepID=A0ABS5SRM5_9PROT|nr:hypothetical protein [Komagataeibacter europaeus]MBT0676893.1 hypothetical protein [Komagataeibacter oboediens]MBT0680223.1 hypothetical protein [Komagataeibacter oboediens]